MPFFTRDGVSVLFVHVPKTGGTAIEDLFIASGWKAHHVDRSGRLEWSQQLRRCSPQHEHADLLRRTLRVGRFDHVFSVVREPLARFRSEFLWRNRKLVDVDEATVDAWADRVLDKRERDPFALDNHLGPQVEFALRRATVHRFEDGLDAVVRDLVETRGLALDADLQHRGRPVASGLSSRDVPLSERLRARLLEVYADDVAAYYPDLR